MLAIAQNSAQYGTTYTDKEFWAVWKKEAISETFEADINNSEVLVLLSIDIEDIITKHKIRDWQHN